MSQLEPKPASCLQVLSNKFSIILLILSFAYLSISLDMSGYFKVGGAAGRVTLEVAAQSPNESIE